VFCLHHIICQSLKQICSHAKLLLWINRLMCRRGLRTTHSKQTYARPPTAPPYINLISHKGLSHLPEKHKHTEPALSLISEMEGGQRSRRCLCVCVQACEPAVCVCVCSHVCECAHQWGRETSMFCARTHTHTPVLTGGCGKEVVPELGSDCLWLRERGIKSSQQLSP